MNVTYEKYHMEGFDVIVLGRECKLLTHVESMVGADGGHVAAAPKPQILGCSLPGSLKKT